MGSELRPYQSDCVRKAHESWISFDRILGVAPTGSGKTRIFSAITKDIIDDGGRVLILAHREELIDQAINRLHKDERIFAEKEKAESKASMGASVVVGSVQSLVGSRRERFGREWFTHIIVDETHHILADSYQSILNSMEGSVLGVTATPDRGDKKNLGSYFQDIAFEIGLLDLIKQGYLCPIACKTVPLNIDLSKVRKTAGDFNAADLDNAIEPILRQAAQQICMHAGDRKVLVFLPLVKTSQYFADICRDFDMNSRWVSGRYDDRKEVLEWFATPGPKVLCNSMLLTEGYDEPSIDCVVCLRPTQSRSLYSQIIGRGTRTHPGKENLLILDFLWHVERHQLVKAASLVSGDEKEAYRITKLMESSGGKQLDLLHLKDEAEEERLKEIEAEHAREISLRRELEKNTRKKGKLIDPVEFALSLHAVAMIDYEPSMPWHSMPISPDQAARIEKAGVDVSMVKNRGHASVILDTIHSRRQLGLATMKQVNLMLKYKHPSAHTATFEEATQFINKIAANGWRK